MVSERIQREYNDQRQKIHQLSETQTMGVKRKIVHEETPQMKKKRVEEPVNPSEGSNSVIVISSSDDVITISSTSVIVISSCSADRNPEREEAAQNDQPDISGPHSSAAFEANYHQDKALGSGGFGQVFAGSRRADHLPVAIKRIAKEDVRYTTMDKNGPQIPEEAAIMLRLMAGRAGSQATSSPVALLDWYDLDDEVILILERPVPCMDLRNFIHQQKGPMTEDQAQVIVKQLVAALLELEQQDVFHRDIKLENVLIETGGDVPRVRIIDFGLSVIAGRWTPFLSFAGTRRHIPPELETYGMYVPAFSTVWQLGALLFDILHEYTRFRSNLFTAKQQRIRTGLSEDCRSFLEECLTISPMERSTLEQLLQHPWMK